MMCDTANAADYRIDHLGCLTDPLFDTRLPQVCRAEVFPHVDPRHASEIVAALTLLSRPASQRMSRSMVTAAKTKVADLRKEIDRLTGLLKERESAIATAEAATQTATAALKRAQQDAVAIEASAAAQAAEIAKLRQQWESVGRMASPSADAEARFTRLEID